MTKFKLPSTDRLLALSAILVSLCTLIVFLYQTNLIRKQQYMSVYPYLEIGHSGIQTDKYNFTIENKGVGPAIIEDFWVGKIGGDLKGQDFVQFLKDELKENETLEVEFSNLYGGRLISEKEVIEVFKSKDSLMTTSQRLYQILGEDNMQFEIIYSSIYGERWKITDTTANPEKLD